MAEEETKTDEGTQVADKAEETTEKTTEEKKDTD